jgi:cell division septation protein DedD
MGQSLAERPAAALRPVAKGPPPADGLAAFDHPPSADGGEAAYKDTFHDSLTSAKPPPDRLPPAPKVQALPAPVPVKVQAPVVVAPAPPVASSAAPTAPAAAVAAAVPAPAPPPASTPVAKPEPKPEPRSPPPPVAVAAPAFRPPASAKGAWVVQVGSTQERFEADRIAARFASRGAKVTVADVPGKGRWYRVRLGSFESREAADRYLKDLERTTGAKGFVASAN